MLWKGGQVPQELGGRRRSHDEKGNQGVGGFRFTNILELFSIYFFFPITLLYHFFLYFFYPRHLPTPTPTTQDPRPLPTTHDPRHLATLFKRRTFTRRAIYRLFQLNVGTVQKCKNAHACLLRDCLGVSRLFVSGTSPKCIDREGLERRCTGTRQA